MTFEETNITEAVVQVAAKAARASGQAMATANGDKSQRIQNVVPKIGRLIMKQPTFHWEADVQYSELKNFIQEVNNIFEFYNMPQTERVTIIKSWLG